MKSILLFLLFPFVVLAQSSIQIVDGESNQPVPFVNIWVKNSQKGTTSTQEGKFEIDAEINDTLVFSAVGFTSLEFSFKELSSKIQLYQSIENLKAVTIEQPRFEKEQIFGSNALKKYNRAMSCGEIPWMVGSRLVFKQEYAKTPFIKSIVIPTRSEVKEAKFAVRLYNDGDTLYQRTLHDNPIYGIAKKGRKNTIIDLSNELIRFPKEGLVVVLEFLMIEQNKTISTVTMEETGKKEKRINYEPDFWTRDQKELSKSSVSYRRGKWWFQDYLFYNQKSSELALQLIMTD